MWAVSSLFPSILTVTGLPVSLTAPLQLLNPYPAFGTAVNSTIVPGA